jgi:hypothetical protein
VSLSSSTSLEDIMGISSAKKGGMKKAQTHRVGPTRQLQARHSDGRAMAVSLQAVLKDGSSMARLVVTLKPHLPSRSAPVRIEERKRAKAQGFHS